ncbi:MAG: glycerophosphodiester phosphodiesterase [Rhodoglobus sp.]|nr:glycerophosphodiester phosphodiesterase [Rhodoglobus sp.]
MASRRQASNQGGGFLSPALPRIFAHRGLALEAPENTLLAFANAIAVGAEYIETDVHATQDGVSVIAHDPDLKRVANRDVRVEQLSMPELRRIDLGYGQGFCTLAEALDGFPETRFNIDIKSRAAVEPTVRAILDLQAMDRVLVSSFDEGRRAAAVRQLPGVVSSASARRFAIALLAGKVGFSPAVNSALRGLVAVQVPERALGLRITTERMLARLHKAGVEVHVWTVNDPARMRELLHLGVDGIVTDRVDLGLEVVRSL